MSATTTARAEIHAAIALAIRDGIMRALAVAGLAAVALIHLLDTPGAFREQPYKGWLYLALIVGSLVTARALLSGSDSLAWVAATLLPLGALAAFVISRTAGLPGGGDDIGNWSEPLGLASLFVEGSLITLGASVIASRMSAVRVSLVRRPALDVVTP